MRVLLPIVKRDASSFHTVSEFKQLFAQVKQGRYILGQGHGWHGGVHLTHHQVPYGRALRAIQSMMDGKIVAYRINDDYLTSTFKTENKVIVSKALKYSNNFVLVEHVIDNPVETDDPTEKSFKFYTLYMHLAPPKAIGINAPHKTRYQIVSDYRSARIFPKDDFSQTPHKFNLLKETVIEYFDADSSTTHTYTQGTTTLQLIKCRVISPAPSQPSMAGKIVWFASGYDAADPLNILNDEAKMTPLASAEPAWMSHATVRDGSIVRLATQAQQIDMVAGSEIGYLGLNESCDNPKGVIQEDYRVHIECFSQEKPPQFFQKMIPDQLKLIDGSDATGVISIKNPFVKKVTQFVVAEQGGTFKAEDFDDEQHPGKLSKYLNERRHYLERLFVKHPSEWFKAVGCEHHENTQRHNLSFMDFIYAQSFRLGTYMESLFRKNYLLPNHQHFCAHEKTRIEMLSWLQDASDLGLTKTLWHLYPLELGWRGFYITREQMAQMFPTQDNTLKARRELVRHLFNEYSDAFEIDNAEKAAQFFAQVKAEVGLSLAGKEEDLWYSVNALKGFTRYFNHFDESDLLGYKRIRKDEYVQLDEASKENYLMRKHSYGTYYYSQLPNEDEIAKRIYSCNSVDGYFKLVEGGDSSGIDYKGKGFIQLTWKGNYEKVNKVLNETLSEVKFDIVKNPNDLLDTRIGFLSALGFWKWQKLNALSGPNTSNTDAITNKVNSKTTSKKERRDNFLDIYKILNKV